MLNNKRKYRNCEEVFDRVFRLFHALLDDAADAALHRQLQEWFADHNDDKLHRKVYDKFLATEFGPNPDPQAEDYRKFHELAEKLGIMHQKKTLLRRRYSTARLVWRAACVVLPLAAIATALFYYTNMRGGQTDPVLLVETLYGVQKEVTLEDDTHVWVNSNSKLSADPFGSTREVHLEGEAYFDVAHDKRKPFIVHVNGLDVRVVGTNFNVKAYPGGDYTEIVLDQGAVRVTASKQNALLSLGQRLTYHHATGEMVITSSDGYNDWRSDVIHAQGRSLRELLYMICNYYDKELVFESGDISDDSRYETKFGKTETAEQVISSLAHLSEEFDYYEKDNTIYITKVKNANSEGTNHLN